MTVWITCKICNRALYPEDGPICCDCLGTEQIIIEPSVKSKKELKEATTDEA